MAEPIKIPMPSGHTNLDSASRQQVKELLISAKIDPAIINKIVNDALGFNGILDSALDTASVVLAEIIAETGLINVDSAGVLFKRTFYEVIGERNEKIDDKKSQNDLTEATTVGSLIGMEVATGYLEQKKVVKSKELQRIKDLYDLGDKATEDEAYGLLLEDLTANELNDIYTSEGALMSTYKHGMTGRTIPQSEMMPVPLSVTKSGEGPVSYWGGIPSISIYESKMTKKEFSNYIRQEKFNYLVERQRAGGLDVDFDKTAISAKEYATTDLDKNYEYYLNYQREVLKDLNPNTLKDAFDRLEAVKEVEGIFAE